MCVSVCVFGLVYGSPAAQADWHMVRNARFGVARGRGAGQQRTGGPLGPG